MAENEQQLLIRFRGICGLIDLNGNGDGDGSRNGEKKKRTILVRHRDTSAGIEPHTPYIEFYADDLLSAPPELTVLQYTRPGSDGTFARINLLEQTVISFKGLGPGYVQEELNYRADVPRISEVLKNGKPEVASKLLVAPDKNFDWTRATAVFDMPAGRLVAGEPEALITRFKPEVNFKPRRLARWSDLYINCASPVVLQLNVLRQTTHEIEFADTLRMLTIGNEPERLILGVLEAADDHSGHTHNGNGNGNGNGTKVPVQPTGHFVLYYDLLENPPADRPVPIPTQLTGTGCPNNNYP